MSYVTGTHNIKVGVTDEQAFNDESRSRNNVVDGLNYDFLNGKPIRLPVLRAPVPPAGTPEHGARDVRAGRVEDRRITLNLGIRYDRISMGYPAAKLDAGLFVPAREVTALSGVPI